MYCTHRDMVGIHRPDLIIDVGFTGSKPLLSLIGVELPLFHGGMSVVGISAHGLRMFFVGREGG